MKILIPISRLIGVTLYIFAALDAYSILLLRFSMSFLIQPLEFLIFGYIFFTFIPSRVILKSPKKEGGHIETKNFYLGVGLLIGTVLVPAGVFHFFSQLGEGGGIGFLLFSPVLLLISIVMFWNALKNL